MMELFCMECRQMVIGFVCHCSLVNNILTSSKSLNKEQPPVLLLLIMSLETMNGFHA